LAGYCWIAQSGLPSNLVDWFVIDNPNKIGFWIWTVNPFFNFNPDPKISIFSGNLNFTVHHALNKKKPSCFDTKNYVLPSK
jgi:hypothetical protein